MAMDILIDKALYLWDLYSEKYRTLPDEYERVVAEARALKVRQNRISSQTKRDYPKIEFLSIDDRKTADKYLEGKTDAEITAIIHAIDLMVNEDFSYKSYVTAICDMKYRIKYKDVTKKGYSLAPMREDTISSQVPCKRTIGTPTDDVFGFK